MNLVDIMNETSFLISLIIEGAGMLFVIAQAHFNP